jgi:hypothetical protein
LPFSTEISRQRRFCYDESVGSRITARHAGAFLRHVVPAIIKPLRSLWNEIIGFLFLIFAVIFGFKTARYAMEFARAPQAEGGSEFLRVAIAGFCTLVMGWYGISSFLRARRISRS